MSPHSDIDLLFLHPWKLTARSEQVVEYVLYMLGLLYTYDDADELPCVNLGGRRIIKKKKKEK